MKRFMSTVALATLVVASFAPHSSAALQKSPERKIAVAVTSRGFQPATIRVKAGKPVRLVVTREVEHTCATDIVLKDYGIRAHLPLHRPVDIRFTPKKAGTVRYACAMDMTAGQLIVQ